MAQVAAQARVDAVVGLKLFARTGACVGKPLAEQAFDHFGIGVVTLALVDDFAVPCQAVAFQGVQDGRLGTGSFTRWVDVFHAQQPLPVHCARIEPGGQGCDQRTKMQESTGSRGEAPDIARVVHAHGEGTRQSVQL
ncbi:hypothetical protein D3C77_565040 [compost metagenome]